MTNPGLYTIAVVSGEDTDVGKSTLARHALRPALTKLYGECDYLLIERSDRSISEGETERFAPDDMPTVLTRCAKARAKKRGLVLELGGGQNDAAISQIEAYKGSEGRVDQWLFPIRATQKADKVIESITRLISLGVAPEKLAIVVNFVPAGRTASDVIDRDMPSLAKHATEYGYRILAHGIPSSDTIRQLRELVSYTVGAIARSTTDYSAQAEQLWAQDRDAEAEQLEKVSLLSMGAAGVVDHLELMVGELLGRGESVPVTV